MDKLEIKKALRKALEIKTIIFIIAVSISLIYYAKCFAQNQILIFKKDSSVILLGIFIMTLWSLAFCLFLLYENRRLLKIIIQKDETIEKLLHEVLNKTDNIENKTSKIEEKTTNLQEAIDYDIERTEDQYTQLIRSNRNTQELILENDRSGKIA